MNPLATLWRALRKPQEPSTIQVVNGSNHYINSLFPTGFFHVRSISRKPAGLGFYCPTCRLSVSHHAPDAIFHCGRLEKLDPEANLTVVCLNNPNSQSASGSRFFDADEFDWNGEVTWDGAKPGRRY